MTDRLHYYLQPNDPALYRIKTAQHPLCTVKKRIFATISIKIPIFNFYGLFGFGSKENIGHRLAANLRDIKRFCDDLLRNGIMRRAQTG
jgi:hypothetical protein